MSDNENKMIQECIDEIWQEYDRDNNNPNINPDQTEEPYNGIDEDCDPITLDDDLDQDGFILADDCNDNNPKVYISSADWMTRNIENRVEVGCPIYDPHVKQELIDTFEISWSDNVKGRLLVDTQQSPYRNNGSAPVRSQYALYEYYQKKLSESN